MDDSTESVTAIVPTDIQTSYTTDMTRSLNDKFPVVLQEGEDNYDEYINMTMNILKIKDDIVNSSQTLNYVLLHSTEPGSEEATELNNSQVSFFRTIMLPSWNSDTR
eukprot:3411586-Amphidinium_carterae.1